jgi:hypothetical protein
MKKHNIILIATFLLTATYSFCQQIPNGGFETWTSTNYFEEPEPYTTSNSLSYMMGDTVVVAKSTDHYAGSYSARLETMALGTDTVPGLMMIGELSGGNIIGGVPFNDRPDSLAGYVKYDLEGGDELYIVCLFTRQGLPIGTIESTFSGTQGNFTRFSTPIDWLIPFLNPDTLKVVISNTSEITTGHPGSTVYLDHFQFIGTTLAFPNGEFEDWTMLAGQEPDNWTTLNYLTSTSGTPYATKTNDKHGGSWALRIENVTSFVGETIGYLTNGDFQGFNWTGGLGVDANPSLISGYYKYLPEGNDTAQAGVFTYYYDASGDSNIIVEQKIVNLHPADTYTYFEIPLEYNSNPPVDTINLAFSGGMIESGLVEGSVLFLDDIQIEYFPVSVDEKMASTPGFLIYPNPCKDYIFIRPQQDGPASGTLELYDAQGKLLLTQDLSKYGTTVNRIDLSKLENGFYYFRLNGSNGQFPGKIIVNK